MGRATGLPKKVEKWIDISIHALRGEGDPNGHKLKSNNNISIHALRGEGDDIEQLYKDLHGQISIHALRGEGDVKTQVI